MTSKFRRADQVHTFECDHEGCRKNYEGDPGDFKFAWRQARAHGWIYQPTYDNGSISEPRHFCPEHAETFERRRS